MPWTMPDSVRPGVSSNLSTYNEFPDLTLKLQVFWERLLPSSGSYLVL